jgi:hypothetical protein
MFITAMRTSVLAALVVHSLAYVSVRRTKPDGSSSVEAQKTCNELAPGVSFCQEVGTRGVDVVLDVRETFIPHECGLRVKKDSYVLAHLRGTAAPSPSAGEAQWAEFVNVDDFTHAEPVRMGRGETVSGWDMAVEGMCEGTKAVITVPPSLGFDEPKSKIPRPASVPVGSTLRYEIEVIKVLRVAEDGVPYRPCFFSLIDTDASWDLDEIELKRHFARINKPVPPHVMNEDIDGDGRISWDECAAPTPLWPSGGQCPAARSTRLVRCRGC